MEVRIDTIDEKEIPSGDIFVSMRVGDMQKQSRFSNSRVFRFPESAEGKGPFGRVELFKRIGHATISLERLLAGGVQELKLPCSQDLVAMGQEHIGLRFTTSAKTATTPAATAQSAVEDAADPKSKKSRAKARMDAAQKYLQEYRLEELLAETMREVISAKPADPRRFIAEKILAEAPPISPISAAPSPLVPVTEAAAPPKASAKMFDDFATYYNANFALLPLDKLYAKFSVKQAAPFVPPPEARRNTDELPPPEAPAKELPAPEEHCWETEDTALEALRKEAASSLIRAAQDGTLEKAMAGAKAAPAQGDAEQAAGLEALRKEAASSLVRAAQDGTLEKVLGRAKVASPQEASGIDELRKEAASSLIRAANDGTLERALSQTKSSEQKSEPKGSFSTYYTTNFSSLPLESLYAKFPPKPKAAASPLDELKKQAATALLRSAGDGSLQELLTKEKLLTDPDDDIVQLRAACASSFLRAAEDGTLERVLAETTGAKAGGDHVEELRKEAASSLLRAAADGTLEKALCDAKSSAAGHDLDSLRKEAASTLLRAAQDGSLMKALSQGKRDEESACNPKSLADQDADRASRIANSSLGGDFKMLPSVGAWISPRSVKAPKAALKSGPAPAAPRQGVLPWADYYKANLSTASAADYPGIYAMFPSKAAAAPAPPPPPPAVQQLEAPEAALKSGPAPAAPRQGVLPWADYYKANFSTASADDYPGIYAMFPSKAAAAPSSPAKAAAASPQAYADFAKQASVGTWLMQKITFQRTGASGGQPSASTSEDHLEIIRQQARAALLYGARSGQLREVLSQFSSTEQLRQQARDALLEGVQSGKLVEALRQAGTLQDDIELLRQQAKGALLQGARSGQLREALQQAPPVQEGIEILRQQARDALLSGVQSGKLREVLSQSADKVAAGSKEERLKQQAREALLRGAQSGSLRAALQQRSEDGMEQLRQQARAALLFGAQSGKLKEVLQASAAPIAPKSACNLLPSVGSWLMRHTIYLPGSQAAARQAPAEALADHHHEHEALGKTAETVLSPESPMAHFVADLFHGTVSADDIEIPDHDAAVHLVSAFKAELDKKDDEIEKLKAKLMELDSV
eukprot:TRINITY_DN1467_c0_g1_i4.p1 TRINITY_DN1467_c0_g1~~TRINITY_DN1467_c0_g1_i4.p1  ORF type:complete len:1122 (+),score=318.99 TRINITY_DN1467_c0_g1_i4:69-3368(+)